MYADIACFNGYGEYAIEIKRFVFRYYGTVVARWQINFSENILMFYNEKKEMSYLYYGAFKLCDCDTVYARVENTRRLIWISALSFRSGCLWSFVFFLWLINIHAFYIKCKTKVFRWTKNQWEINLVLWHRRHRDWTYFESEMCTFFFSLNRTTEIKIYSTVECVHASK